ncbi:MAG: DUF1501 domain-containing protein [Planctomycetaceae bacterium]
MDRSDRRAVDRREASAACWTRLSWCGGRNSAVRRLTRHGRTRRTGRDHHPFAGTFWMVSAGVKPGLTLGGTDELGFMAVERPTEVFDVQATILHLMGLDHLRLTYRSQGRDFRLTDVSGHVIQELLA